MLATTIGAAALLTNAVAGRGWPGQSLAIVLSRLLNSGTVWAGLAIVVGMLLRRPLIAGVGGVLASVWALLVNDTLGWALGVLGRDAWALNAHWYLLSLVIGGPLGLLGWLARGPGLVGLVGRLSIPLGAVLETLVRGYFTPPGFLSPAARFGWLASGWALLVGGVLGAGFVLHQWRNNHRARQN